MLMAIGPPQPSLLLLVQKHSSSSPTYPVCYATSLMKLHLSATSPVLSSNLTYPMPRGA